MQRRLDQGPYLCNMLCGVPVIQFDCLWQAQGQSAQHRCTHSASRVFFQRKYFTHNVQIKQEVQQGSFIATEKGENNLQSHNQRQEQSPRAICFCKCHSPKCSCHSWWCIRVTESHDKGCSRWWGCDYPPQKKLFYFQMPEVLPALLLGQ